MFAVGQQALFLFSGKTGLFKTDGHFAQLCFLRAVHLQLIAQFTIKLFAFIAPVIELLQALIRPAQRAMKLTQLLLTLLRLLLKLFDLLLLALLRLFLQTALGLKTGDLMAGT